MNFQYWFFKSWWSDEFHVTKDVFKERITSILKKRINPKPNATDKIMYPIYRRFSFYFPFVAFVSIFYRKSKIKKHLSGCSFKKCSHVFLHLMGTCPDHGLIYSGGGLFCFVRTPKFYKITHRHCIHIFHYKILN